MLRLIIAALVCAAGFVPAAHAQTGDKLAQHTRSQAITDCHNRPANKVPIEVIDELLKLERAHLPDVVRGLLLAAACNESGYRSHVAGDGGKSVGMFQFYPWAKRHLRKLGAKNKRDPRLDWRASAQLYINHTLKQLQRVRRACKGKRGFKTRERQYWASANATAIRYPLCKRRDVRGRCTKHVPRCAWQGSGSETLHSKMARRWRRSYPGSK